MDIEEAKSSIEKAIDTDGPYSNNVVGSVLRLVDAEHGIKAALALMDEYELEEMFGIQRPKEIDK